MFWKGDNSMTFDKQIMSAVIIMSCFGNSAIGQIFGTTTQHYSYLSLDKARQEIQENYIDLSTAEVVKRADNAVTDPSICFEQDFLASMTDDEPIGNKRATQRRMELIREACRQQKVSGLKLELNEFHEDIAIAFQNKEDALNAEHDGLWTVQMGYGIITSAGLLALLLASLPQREERVLRQSIALGGGFVGIAGGVGLYSTVGKRESLKVHMSKVQTMKNGWENSSGIFKQKESK